MRDVSPVIQHVEKIVLAVCVLLLVLVVAYFFVGSPFTVKRGAQSVDPVTFENQLSSQIGGLGEKVNSSTVPRREVAPYAQVFTDRYTLPLPGSGRPLMPMATLGLPQGLFDGIEVAGGVNDLTVPTPPIAYDLKARQGYAVLDWNEVSGLSGAYAQIVGNQRPSDFRYVSVMGTFDFSDWQQRLAENDIPEGWRSNRRGLAQVYLIRQQWDESSQTWSAAQRIAPLPDQLAFGIQDISYTEDLAERIVNEIILRQDRIARPDFAPSKRVDSGGTWIAPNIERDTLTPAEQRELDQLNREIATLQADLDQLRLQYDRQQDSEADTAEAGAIDPVVQRMRSLRDQLTPLLQARADLTGQDADLAGVNITGLPGDEQFLPDQAAILDPSGRRFGADAARGSADGDDDASLSLSPQVRVWAHDLTAEPGQTYRYKIVAAVVNPLFHQSRLPEQQRIDNLNRLVLYPDEFELEQSEWTEAMTIDPLNQFFVVGGQANVSRATVEVWRIYDGRWLVNEFEVIPGDRLGGEAILPNGREIDLSLDAMVVDVREAQHNDRSAVELLFTMPDQDTIDSRIDRADTSSEQYRKLQTQKSTQDSVASTN